MNLLEHQGKSILSRYGIAVPNGAMWPALPEGVERFTVKAQVRSGGRGRAGASRDGDRRPCGRRGAGRGAARYGARALPRRRHRPRPALPGHPRVAGWRGGDRDGAGEAAAPRPHRSFPRPAPLSLAPGGRLTWPRPRAAVAALYALAEGEDATLAEINPLAVTTGGEVVAADAKLVLDPRAAYRQPGHATLAAPPEGSAIERAVAAAGGTAVEIDPAGAVVAIVSGAGLTMATCDMLVDLGVRVRCVIDLGGGLIGKPEAMVPVFRAVAALEPRVTFINAYLHSSLADDFARAVAAAHREAPVRGRVLLRLLGRNAEEGRRILAPLGFELHEALGDALAAVVGAARAAA